MLVKGSPSCRLGGNGFPHFTYGRMDLGEWTTEVSDVPRVTWLAGGKAHSRDWLVLELMLSVLCHTLKYLQK